MVPISNGGLARVSGVANQRFAGRDIDLFTVGGEYQTVVVFQPGDVAGCPADPSREGAL
ncbi:hypothetical protein D3C84_1064540 [compost metagenome]